MFCLFVPISQIALALSLRPGQGTLLTVLFGVMGFAMMPILPLTFETAVEFTYPVDEEGMSRSHSGIAWAFIRMGVSRIE